MTITFRPLTPADHPRFAHWLAQPYVARWWREPATVEHVAAEYGNDPLTAVYVVLAAGKPIGIIQVFRLADYPEYDELFPLKGAVSIDYLIGEPDHIGRGYGKAMIKTFLEQVVRPGYPEATGVTTSVEVDNGPSLGVLRSCGFEPGGIITGEYGTPERVMTLGFQRS